MPDRDVALDDAISEIAPILADALLRVLLQETASEAVDFAETERPHVNAG
jgi:hypothetical protein